MRSVFHPLTGVTDLDTLKQKDFSFTPESLRVRCPHCRKLYLVQRSDIRETRPRFECVQCRERFWLSIEEVDANQEMIGLPIQVREAPKPQRVEPCPKCRAPIHVGVLECKTCGVVVSKWRSARLTNLSITTVPRSTQAFTDLSWGSLISTRFSRASITSSADLRPKFLISNRSSWV